MTRKIRLRRWLSSALILLAIGPMILSAMVLGWYSFDEQQSNAVEMQQATSKHATAYITRTLRELESDIRLTAKLTGLINRSQDEQFNILSKLRSHTDHNQRNILSQLSLLDANGQQQVFVSRNKIFSENQLGDFSQSEGFKHIHEYATPYYSPIWTDENTGDPYLEIGIPLANLRNRTVDGIVIAQLRVKELWNIITDLSVGHSGMAYILTAQGIVIAHPNPSVVLRQTKFELPTSDGLQQGLSGEWVILARESIRLGKQTIYIITELPAAEGLRAAIHLLSALAFFAFLGLCGGILLWLMIAKKVIAPVESLTQTARAISGGDMEQRIDVSNAMKEITEMGEVADSFNDMMIHLHHREQSLKHAKWAAESADRAKSVFIATMSHELRTPLNGILGMSQVLQFSELNEEQAEQVSTIYEAGNALVVILNDILDLSVIEADKMKLNPKQFNFEQLGEDLIRLVHFEAEGKGLKVNFEYQESCPKYLWGDEGRIRQVLLNLVSNAIKFTPTGQVSVYISGHQTSSDLAEVRVKVTDSGIGITEEAQGYIFDAFSQADDSSTRRFGGTGLGLAISKRLIEMMGGEIGVESVPGQGATFWLKINLPIDLSCEKANKRG